MSKYKLLYSCGHLEETELLKSPPKLTFSNGVYKKAELCPKCLLNAIQEQRKTNQQAIIIAKEMNLVDLTGTEKQVEWANVLRLKILDRVDNLIKKEKDKDKKVILEKFREDLIKNPSASFWIKHRNDNLKTWINRTLKRGLLGEEHINIKYE